MFPPSTVYQSNQLASVFTYVHLSSFTTYAWTLHAPRKVQIFSCLLTSISLLFSPLFFIVSFPPSLTSFLSAYRLPALSLLFPNTFPHPQLLPNFSRSEGKTPLNILLFLPFQFPLWRQTQCSSISLFVSLLAVFDTAHHSFLLETSNTWLLGHLSRLMFLWLVVPPCLPDPDQDPLPR